MVIKITDIDVTCPNCQLGLGSMEIDRKVFVREGGKKTYAFFATCRGCNGGILQVLPINQKPLNEKEYKEVKNL